MKYRPLETSDKELAEFVDKIGKFDCWVCADAVIGVEGMTCGSCVASITTGLKDVDGVWEVDVSLEKKEA